MSILRKLNLTWFSKNEQTEIKVAEIAVCVYIGGDNSRIKNKRIYRWETSENDLVFKINLHIYQDLPVLMLCISWLTMFITVTWHSNVKVMSQFGHYHDMTSIDLTWSQYVTNCLENDLWQKNLGKNNVVEKTFLVEKQCLMSMCDINLIPTVDVNLMSTVNVSKHFIFDLWLMVSQHQKLTSLWCQFTILNPLGTQVEKWMHDI